MLDSLMFKARCAALLAAHPGRAFVWLNETSESADSQNQIQYLTGISGAPLGLILGANAEGEAEAVLFITESDPQKAHWEGVRLGVSGAQQRLGDGFEVRPWTDNLWKFLEMRLSRGQEQEVGYRLGQNLRQDLAFIETLGRVRASRQAERKDGKGLLAVIDPLEDTAAARMCKDVFEIQQLTEASRVTARAFAALLAGGLGPLEGVTEASLARRIEAMFADEGGDGLAYPSIVAFGANGTCLHHGPTQQKAIAGELVLVDAGASVGGYASDVTRVFPVSGSFSEAQAAVYDAVLKALLAATDAAQVGNPLDATHCAALASLEESLVGLGLPGPVTRWFTHQTSHWIGLNVHDPGPRRPTQAHPLLREGMCLSVEPGLYIPLDAEDAPSALRGIGIRLEDTVLITAQGPKVLTDAAPKLRADIEAPRRT